MAIPPLRDWQKAAISTWEESGFRGIVSVVTGGGKTLFALACVEHLKPNTVLVVVPTVALLDQWWEESASGLGLKLDEVHIVGRHLNMKSGTVNLAVINTAAKIKSKGRALDCLLIVDECHKAASERYRDVLSIPTMASLGLSATPERPYDDGLRDVLEPNLGPVIYRYSYADALSDGVIVPFDVNNVVFELEEDRRKEYERLTRQIARSVDAYGPDAQETVSLYVRRSRILNLSLNRIRAALKLVRMNLGKRILVFHEDTEACDLICQVLVHNGVRSGLYHSKVGLKERARMLGEFRRGEINVLVTCRALDEGFNVPEADVGIIAASTATRRQRIQRMGRVLRPSKGKQRATIYTLVATDPEVGRLKDEEQLLEGVADVRWSAI